MPANLHLNGDPFEKKYWGTLAADFPNYEVLWREVIEPLRVAGGINLRPGIELNLERLAQVHYSLFVDLAYAKEALSSAISEPYKFDEFFFRLEHATLMV